jgi:hypothetical protein
MTRFRNDLPPLRLDRIGPNRDSDLLHDPRFHVLALHHLMRGERVFPDIRRDHISVKVRLSSKYRMRYSEIMNESVYRDVLGTPQPIASIFHSGGAYRRGGYWLLTNTAANLPPGRYRWDTPEQAEHDMVAQGWRVIERVMAMAL